jgi:DNA-binding XRE family transcriptional regulator
MKDKEKKLAEQLYIYSGASQSKIAEDLGISEKTFTKWKDEGDWDKIKSARNLGKDQLICNLYNQALRITQSAEDEIRELNSKEMDIIIKISSTIDKLDKKLNLPNIITVFKEFNTWLSKVNPTFAKQITEYQKKFVHYINESE